MVAPGSTSAKSKLPVVLWFVSVPDVVMAVGAVQRLPAGMVVVAEGTDDSARRLERVLTTDPGTGVVRHADAGYDEAKAFAEKSGVKVPMGKG